jgi:DNA mismatch repair ATPase MutL
MPVRRNILNNIKKVNQEIKAVEILLKSYAICKPSIKFMFRVNSNMIFTKSSDKDIFETLKCILGTQVFSKLTYIEKISSQVK